MIRTAKGMQQPRTMQGGEGQLMARPANEQGSLKLHEISTQSIIQTSALFHRNAATLLPPNNERQRQEVVVSPEPNCDEDEEDAKYLDEEDSEKDDMELSMIHANRESPPPTLIDNFVSADCRVRVLSPLGEPKEVRFRDIPSDDEEDDSSKDWKH
jgi:hypothetical protein